MKKTELIRRIAKSSGYKQQIVNEILDVTFDELRQALLDGESFAIERFISFRPKLMGARMGRNPLTGEQVDIPPSLRLKTTVSAPFKKELQARTPGRK